MRLMALGAFQLRFIRQVITISAASLNAPYGARCYLTHVQRPPSRAGCGVLMRRLVLSNVEQNQLISQGWESLNAPYGAWCFLTKQPE